MFTTAFLVAAATFTTIISAAPTASWRPFQITNTTIERVVGGNVTFQFTVHDPEPLANITQVCKGWWVTGSRGFPNGPYEPCGNSTLGWNMQKFNGIGSFVLGVEHAYKDPSVGDPPYDWVTTYGKANVTLTGAACTFKGDTKTCRQSEGTIIRAPIYASSA